MTKTEALQFLDLPLSATEADIKARLQERLAHYEELSEKSPSDFLRRLNEQHAGKVREIIKESMRWEAYVAPEPVVVAPEPPPPEEPKGFFVDEEVVVDAPPDNMLTRFVTGLFTMKRKESISETAPVGWLIRHTENLPAQALPLFAGKNYIGRKASGKFKPFLTVEEDPHVSKVHAVIFADPGEIYLFYVADIAASNEGKASTNGTYVNGQEKRITDKMVVRENDTIQIGVTKFVLRYAESDPDGLIRDVSEKPYAPTIVVGDE
jgi:hypothetical protein